MRTTALFPPTWFVQVGPGLCDHLTYRMGTTPQPERLLPQPKWLHVCNGVYQLHAKNQVSSIIISPTLPDRLWHRFSQLSRCLPFRFASSDTGITNEGASDRSQCRRPHYLTTQSIIITHSPSYGPAREPTRHKNTDQAHVFLNNFWSRHATAII